MSASRTNSRTDSVEEKLRIGFDARWYNTSGVGRYVAELMQAFAEIEDGLELIVFENPENPVPACSNVRKVAVRSSRFSLSAQFEFRSLCRSHGIDIFHVPFQYGAPLFLPCPMVITIHDLTPFLFRTRSWLKQMLAVPLVKVGYLLAARCAEHIIADSENTARDARRILGIPRARITPIHLAASQKYFHAGGLAGEAERILHKYSLHAPFVMLSSADNWRVKNMETALRALALARDFSAIEFDVVIYGPEAGLNALEKRNLTSRLRIRRAGYVPLEDLGALFRNASLFINASLYEGFGLPVLEAMSCGCPVVSSNGGSLAEVAGRGAQLFDPMDAQGMARAISNLLCNPDERERWRSRALARASEFSWRKTAEQTLLVYKQACRSPHLSHDFEFSHDAPRPRA
jgi:glycosyltransferase involved in cell wall biosynthesis